MNHTREHTYVSCHDYSHSFHHKTLLFSPCCKPCSCNMDSVVNLNFFFYVFRLQCFHKPNIQPLSQLFIFRFILFMFGPTCANIPLPSISLVVIIVSAQNGSVSLSDSCPPLYAHIPWPPLHGHVQRPPCH